MVGKSRSNYTEGSEFCVVWSKFLSQRWSFGYAWLRPRAIIATFIETIAISALKTCQFTNKLPLGILKTPMLELGLIGKCLTHSFSPAFFAKRASEAGIEARYRLFELPSIAELPLLWGRHPELVGLNVTLPYKTEVLPYLKSHSPGVEAIGAANTLLRLPSGGWHGHNTDAAGFAQDLAEWCPALAWAQGAVVAGAGGAARAAVHALAGLGCPQVWVLWRTQPPTGAWPHPSTHLVPFAQADGLPRPSLLVHCTPAGMHPHPSALPPIPRAWLGPGLWVYDMVYNPAETRLMQVARAQGAQVRNGLGMLHAQAEAAWQLWTAANG
jgi:shikimate dehydrogenase